MSNNKNTVVPAQGTDNNTSADTKVGNRAERIREVASTLVHSEVSEEARNNDTLGNRVMGGTPIMQKGFRFFISGTSESEFDNNGTPTLLHNTDIVAADFSAPYTIPNSAWVGSCRDTNGTRHTSESLCKTDAQKDALAYKDVRGAINAEIAKKLLDKNGIEQMYEVVDFGSYECPLRNGGTYWKNLYAIIKVEE